MRCGPDVWFIAHLRLCDLKGLVFVSHMWVNNLKTAGRLEEQSIRVAVLPVVQFGSRLPLECPSAHLRLCSVDRAESTLAKVWRDVLGGKPGRGRGGSRDFCHGPETFPLRGCEESSSVVLSFPPLSFGYPTISVESVHPRLEGRAGGGVE